MRHITINHMSGFTGQLQKEASLPRLIQLGRALRERGGKRLATRGGKLIGGAGAGAVGGAASAEEGESKLRKALLGAGVGAGLIGGGILATKGGREAAKGALSRFGQRQRYALTGRGIKDVEHAQRLKLLNMPTKEHFTSPLSGQFNQKAYDKAVKQYKLEEEAFKKGYQSVPGVAHAFLSGQAGDVIRSGWKRGGTPTKLFAGLGAYQTGKGLIEKPQPGGPGRLEKGLRGAGSALGWMVAPQTLVAGPLLGTGGQAIGGAVGKVGDVGARAVKRRLARPETPQRAYGGYGDYQWH